MDFVRWAVHAADQGRIRQATGATDRPMPRLPDVGDTLVNDDLVDPQTGLPCPVRVVEIHLNWEPGVHVVVVTREQ